MFRFLLDCTIEESKASVQLPEKRSELASKTDKQSTVTESTDLARLAPSKHVQPRNVQQVEKKIEELKAELDSLLEASKKKRDYTSLLSDSHNIKGGDGNKNQHAILNKKRKERRKNNRADRLHEQTKANKTHQKPLECGTYK